MKTRDYCPYCEKLVMFSFNEEECYEDGKCLTDCKNCNKEVLVKYYYTSPFTFKKKEDDEL